ncbi:YlbF family regulator [Pseudolactococcus reticulitermitis]|uniref:Uncharacterized protein n=1 Tax=Pseudolactococcus reticulitermitis TaxID=2025039 RepID=A0A224WYA3_9LACT|nr:YlbF family regulator [Lactococcus reticulitermitis]GAX47129.1 hypothetical protein RsY01_711 [Lactococcus reticulitermitis]GHU36415.1 hypothetical protein FACS1894192_02950 [Bacilli bacterium]GHU40919.1 hypothetical protein FACS1894193_03960 [Bacilli bacterium]GHU45201.1 hypothetical protein FACS1894194_0390 [Bacilli bacterium]
MPSSQTDYNQALAALLVQVSQHPVVLDFQAAEKRLKAAKELYALESEMKELAKQATLYQKIDKVKAYQETMARSKAIEAQLNDEPLIIDYRRKLVAANDLLQHLLQTLETQINEELYRDN